MSNPQWTRGNFKQIPRFVFRLGKNDKNLKEVKANSYDQAATIAARKLYGNVCTAMRVWGMPEYCGYFQAYYLAVLPSGNQMRCLGKPFWLQMTFDYHEAQLIKGAYRMYEGLKYIRNADLKKGNDTDGS